MQCKIRCHVVLRMYRLVKMCGTEFSSGSRFQNQQIRTWSDLFVVIFVTSTTVLFHFSEASLLMAQEVLATL